MHRTTILIALALGCAAAVSCVQTSYTLNPGHCSGAQDGNSFCGEQYPDGSKTFCRYGSDPCNPDADADFDGCVAERPEDECYSPCGRGDAFADDPSCLDEETTVADASTTEGSSSSGDTETSGTTVEPETDTEEESSTTGPECSEDVPCSDAAAPFCVDGTCSTCDVSVDPAPDDACAMLDEGMPLCVETECVQCTAEDAGACEGTTPLCDDANNTCVGCSFHEECQDLGFPACNIATGACFSNDAVTMVNGATNGALATAVANVADGSERAIVLTGGGGNNAIVVDGGKTIAIVSDGTTERVVQGSTGNPTVTVTGAGSTVYLHRLALTLNGDDVGASVESSGTLYADSTRVAQNSGGGIELAAGTSGFLRNCMVGGAADAVTLDASSATVELLYSSVLGGLGDADGFVCSSGINISIRNSIITTRGSTPALGCAGADVSNTAIENTGMTSWFADYNGGDAHLEAAGQTEFADVAVWELGDPPFDFDGDARPNTDGAMGYAGADTVP